MGTDKDGLANLFANYFSLRQSEVLVQSATTVLQAGKKVLLDNYHAYKALDLPKNATTADCAKLTKDKIGSAIAKMSVTDLDAFVKAAQEYKKKLDEALKQLDTTNDKNAKKLKAALTLPPNYDK